MERKANLGTSRKRHSQQHKAEAVALAERVGIPAAAKQLGIHESQLYSWRLKIRLNQECSAVEERLNVEKGRRVLCEEPEVKNTLIQHNKNTADQNDNIQDGSDDSVLPASKIKPSLSHLLDQVTKENQHSEVSTGRPAGKEIW